MRRVVLLLLLLLLLDALAELLPLVPDEATPPAPRYASDTAWLCRPGRADTCGKPTNAMIVAAGGARTIATYAPDPAAPIDCFYVYPTVSRAPGFSAPIAATGMEEGAARQQLARFATVCRPFAPLYRQLTTAGLRAVLAGDPARAARTTAYADVVAAFHDYLARDNGGRGFVLIGHSQGAKILARLIAAEIDGKPLQARLVAAIIPGTEVDVPGGARVGGTFKHVPLCASAAETGCVIAYSSYPADRPVPADTMFGTVKSDAAKVPGMRYACVDPAALAGAQTLDADLPNLGLGTDFVELPGLLRARCADDGRTSVLAIAWDGEARLGEPTGTLLTRIAGYAPSTGLHALDVNLALGTLVGLVRAEAAAYARSQGRQSARPP